MSEIGETTEEVTELPEGGEVEIPEIDAPAEDGGQADGEGEVTQEADVFNVDEYGDREVVVKVDGEEVKVPLKEALSGYQRQADYTRKTQGLSRAQALMEALESNPQGTLSFLQQQYGNAAANEMVQSAQTETASDDGWDDSDPVASAVRSMRAELEELRSYQTNQVLDNTLNGLKAKYGDDFNEQEVIQAAAQRQISTPGELEGVFRDLMFDKFYATAKAKEEAAGNAAAEKAAREAAKQQLAGTVTSGNGAPKGSVGAPPTSFDSIEDAFAAAASSLGISL